MSIVGIKAFSLISSLGNSLQQHAENSLNGVTAGMMYDDELLFGKPTIVGKINEATLYKTASYVDNEKLIPDNLAMFDYRANRLIVMALVRLANEIDNIKSKYPSHKIGVIIGTTTSGFDSFERNLPLYYKNKSWNADYKIHHQRMAGVAEFIARYLQLCGPALAISTACSSSTIAISSAKNWLNSGICDAVITGGIDILTNFTLLGFDSLGALSPSATNPFSVNRCGINIGEGVGLFILDKNQQQINILGSGNSSDGYHFSAPDPSGKGAATAMKQAITSAGLHNQDIDYVNLHGTATPQNDAMESLALAQVFNDQLTSLACSSTKPMTGHCLGACGAIEIGLTALSMLENFNPQKKMLPHIYDGEYDQSLAKLNLVKPDNKLGLPKIALSNSFAFGGSNSCLIIGKQ